MLSTSPIPKHIILQPWEELIGIYAGADNGMHMSFLTFRIMEPRSNTLYLLTYPLGSLESAILEACLSPAALGQQVTVLRTDIPSKPIIARVLKHKEGGQA